MGIKGIYGEIGPGQRIALAKLAVEAFELRDRPLRLAIDISIWLFQIQSGKGGTNPALRTFYYRLLRLISLGIHPLFVFDGSEKPPFKRNKRTGPNVASVPEFLAKQLLKQFGFPFHVARGEAEAECALLQRKGVVDAVLSEDVDTLMFGSGLTLRNWSPLATTKSKVPTHVNVYDAQKTKAGPSGLDRNGMILIALMSGGDYIPEGIPGCGVKTACEAARAGFGDSLCKIDRHNRSALLEWKSQLIHELRTNESKFFRQKHRTLAIPDEFPRSDVIGYYTHPVVSADANIERLRNNLKWDQDIDIPALRSFCADAFDWVCISGAKHFARKLAPSLLVKELRLRAERNPPDDLEKAAQEELFLVKDIYGQRQSATTDNSPELRISFVPLDLVKIDLDAEDPDPEIRQEALDSDGEGPVIEADEAVDGPSVPASPRKARGPTKYDPTTMQKAWIPETFIRVGVPLKTQDWEECYRNTSKYEAMKAARRTREKTGRKKKAASGMPQGALNRFTQSNRPASVPAADVPNASQMAEKLPAAQAEIDSVDLRSLAPVPSTSLAQAANEPTSTSVAKPNKRKQATKRPSQNTSKTDSLLAVHSTQAPTRLATKSTFRVPAAIESDPATPKKKQTQLSIISLLSSPLQMPGPAVLSTARQESVPANTNNIAIDAGEPLQLPSSVNTRRRRLPLKLTETLPNPTTDTPHAFDACIGSSPPRKRPNVSSKDDGQLPDRPSTPKPVSNVIELLSSSPLAPITLARVSDETDVDAPLPGSPSPIRYRNKDVEADVTACLQDDNAVNNHSPAAQVNKNKSKYIRLRESMNGAFAFGEDTQSSPGVEAHRNSAAAGQARRGKTWRMSAVQHMDLTME